VLEGVFARLGEDWEVFEVAPEELLDAGDRVVALGRYNATYKATGRRVQAQFVHVCGVRGGRVTSFQQYTDTKHFADAVASQEAQARGVSRRGFFCASRPSIHPDAERSCPIIRGATKRKRAGGF
jgi:hypothetical protein